MICIRSLRPSASWASTKAPLDLPDAADSMSDFTRWEVISLDERLLAGLPAMVRGRMTDLLRIEQGFRAAVGGDVIAHDDVRADNILISDGHARFVDWPHARRGAPWIDLPCLLPSVEHRAVPRAKRHGRCSKSTEPPPVHDMLPVISGFASYLWFRPGATGDTAASRTPRIPAGASRTRAAVARRPAAGSGSRGVEVGQHRSHSAVLLDRSEAELGEDVADVLAHGRVRQRE